MAQSRLIQRSSTPGFSGYSCSYSPFFTDKLAVATAANFGLVGNGRLNIFKADPASAIQTVKIFDTQDGLYDVAWSEIHENQLATASGDGSIKLWDIMLNDYPVQSWHEHKREVFCLDWNNLKKDIFASCSWDHLVKIWTPSQPTSIMTIPAHDSCIYAARFSPLLADTLATCSSDGSLKIWDTRTSPAAPPPVIIQAHSNEVLSLDWNKYATHIVATASVDRTVRIHDIRKVVQNSCIETLVGHQYAIRKVAWSPHAANQIATSGYDMTARVWIVPLIGDQAPLSNFKAPSSVLGIHHAHKEFVIGLAWSFHNPGLIASASWDQEVHIWSV